nr:uncharacterized protein LOC125423901 [Ziziphus jujuba var. spinosa]
MQMGLYKRTRPDLLLRGCLLHGTGQDWMGYSPNLVFGKENGGWDTLIPLTKLSASKGTKLTHQNTWVTFVLPSFEAFNLSASHTKLLLPDRSPTLFEISLDRWPLLFGLKPSGKKKLWNSLELEALS